MAFYILWIIALGLSMGAFAVSISKGLAAIFSMETGSDDSPLLWLFPSNHAAYRLCIGFAI